MESSRNWRSSALASLPPGAAVCVGFSGGLDSTVLLDLLAKDASHPLTALHVHHGLSPNADRWAEACTCFCAARGIALAIERVNVPRDSGDGLEAAARSARYAAYARRTEPFVALAHHLDDQAETVLLQLLRGTGLKGVAAMPRMRALAGSGVTIARPLLAATRVELRAYAAENALEWIEDESNLSSVHDRNYLRGEIAPLLDARFPGWREAAARFARHAASADEALDELARDDGPDAPMPRWDVCRDPMYIHRTLSAARRANALRAFLARNQVPMPGTTQLDEMTRQVYDSRDDAEVRLDHAGISLVRQGNFVYIESRPWAGEPWRVAWRGEHELQLGGSRGSICFKPVVGEGIDARRTREGEWHLGSRSGGERIRLRSDGPSRTVKKVLQEKWLSRWQRQNLPCLFHDGRLVWMDMVGIDAEYRCPEGAEGVSPRWRMALAGSSVVE